MAVVAGMSDLIVIGQIGDVNTSTYEFNITEVLKGTDKKKIKVRMFKEWVCDSRLEAAANGQSLILFLQKKTFGYEIINGSTGEIFIKSGKVMRDLNGTTPTINELKKAIRNFTSLYTFARNNYSYRKDHKNAFKQIRPFAEILEHVEKGGLTKWLIKQTEWYDIV